MVPFKYPFYNGADTRCSGLIRVNCGLNHTKIQLGNKSYKMLAKVDYDSSVLIYNKTFEKLVNHSSCEALMNNFTSPSPLLYSILIAPFITLFKCTNSHSYSQEFDAYFDKHKNYSRYRCDDHSFYYKYLISNIKVPSDLPRTCQVIQLPVSWNNHSQGLDVDKIFSLLSSYFHISFMLSPSCAACNKKGGKCHAVEGHFQCSDAKNGIPARKLILILVLTGSTFLLMLSFVIFIIWRRYKNNPFSYFSSKDKKASSLEDGSLVCGVSVFSYTELEYATQNFNPSHELGDGGFGAVYYGKLKDGREVAVKRLYEHNYKRVQQFLNEALVSDSKGEIMAMITSVAELAFRCLQYHSEMRPTMNEVLDVLMDIQGEGKIDDHDSIRDLENVQAPPPSKASDKMVLLKDFLPSPVSVTSEWQSETSASTTISSNCCFLSFD
ncbi:concanavalin A-like lectin/glucanase domain, Serine/threonine-protein kinase, Ulk1/Ulk2 [Artemisia annua]|uniref:Concanavalin A-like lectin/glucanase domain, Serine/threonine-protein kinase, Ulk1/Ulk2 n=1 Tax=Artemisia annua TaxID=35608 RepID=A0A2U1PHS4_ARTAN|nr:concanavalin A-like lectin/glucanase domain, Serine/threonine-protein kinase, Ulk1/Ulk2 [Artemisia annua]